MKQHVVFTKITKKHVFGASPCLQNEKKTFLKFFYVFKTKKNDDLAVAAVSVLLVATGGFLARKNCRGAESRKLPWSPGRLGAGLRPRPWKLEEKAHT